MTDPVYVVLTIELSNGHFKSSIRQPIDASIEDKRRFVDEWLDLMQFGLKSGATAIDAQFAPKDLTP